MCNVTPAMQGAFLLSDTLTALSGDTEDNELAAPRYQYNLDALEHSRGSARLNAQNVMADAETSRRNYQREAAQEAGRARTGYGASGLGLDSGSILTLLAEQSAKTQSESADISAKAARSVAAQRQNEEYYAQKKNLLHEITRREQKKTLLGGYGRWRNALDSSAGLRELI